MSPRDTTHDVALWASLAAFFGSLLAIGLIDVFNPGHWIQLLGGILVAVITAGSVYAKERLAAAKREEKAAARPSSRKSS